MIFRDAERQLLSKVEKHSNIKYNSLQGLATRYNEFVSACEIGGYGDWLVEFDNDIFARNLIEEIIRSGQLASFKEFNEWKQYIDEIDTRLKNLFVKDKERYERGTWWQKGILKNGYGYYQQDILESYGINLE
jgi:hypothetical protein